MNKEVCIFLADGFEEAEALVTADILRRAGAEVKLVSVTGGEIVKGAHGISVFCDALFDNCEFYNTEMLVLPGGLPGAETLNGHEGLRKQLLKAAEAGKTVAAICAAPMVLGGLGLLKGKKATCYPGFECYMEGADYVEELPAVTDGNVITGRGPGASFAFGFALAEHLFGAEKVGELKKAMCAQ